MKKVFQEYFPLDDQVLSELWKDAIFVFDTSVLLNLYRYSQNTSNEFIDIITMLKERTWLPFQVGLEFNKNRLNVISDQKKNYLDFEKKIHLLIEEIENQNRNPFFSKALTERIVSIKKDLNIEIEQRIKEYDDSLKIDLVLDKLNLVFEDKIGNELSSEEINKFQKEGERRYKNKIPPGYCDLKKPENERYGDFFLWQEIIKKSKDETIDVIFVLDDRKEDWWFEHQGKTISPRPELLKEFRLETKKNIHFYKPFQFLEYSNKYLESKIGEDVIQEVKNYEHIIRIDKKFIQIYLTLQGDIKDIHLLTNDIKNTGYNILTESDKNETTHFLNITLPNIPDLERRFNSKFISKLSEYKIKLIEINKTTPTSQS
ncbi:PIN-like domain-containing protein [Confluentibacter flavum]|uniref:PIN like domain-containing protein n=1 Tax=Confluentibacter flavum TaxID=1909700 RepID=A0A2N3HHF8_9FLAO|nr:PIN-like domain-containing protein [Confluentibacter flavum]PKQ44248.1 hypothetical protein CSW08_14200 [Confluentibacter flavum]